MAWLSRSWFYLALTATFALGFLSPETADLVKSWLPISYLVAIAFFLNGLTISASELAGSLRHWRVLAASLAIIFALTPALTLCIRLLIPGGDTPLGHGFQLLAVVPTTLVSAVVLTQIARGNNATALYVTVLANFVAIILVPPIMRLTLGKAGAEFDMFGTSVNLMLTVLVPTLLGQLVRQRWRRHILAYDRPINTASRVMILFFIMTGLAALERGALPAARWLVLIAVSLGVHIGLLGIGLATGRLLRVDTATRHAIAISSSQKSLAVANLLWEKLLAPLGSAYGIALLPCIVYYVIETLFDSFLAQWWGQAEKARQTASALISLVE